MVKTKFEKDLIISMIFSLSFHPRELPSFFNANLLLHLSNTKTLSSDCSQNRSLNIKQIK